MSHIHPLSLRARTSLLTTAHTQHHQSKQFTARTEPWIGTRGLSTRPSSRRSGKLRGEDEVEVGNDRDLVGLPDPVSNLRPVIYASPFRRLAPPPATALASASTEVPTSDTSLESIPSSGIGSSSGTRTETGNAKGRLEYPSSPYSNSEFLSPTSSSSSSAPPNLSHTSVPISTSSNSTLPLTDPSYPHRLQLERLDRQTHDFWAESNLLFEAHLRKRLEEVWPGLEQEVRGGMGKGQEVLAESKVSAKEIHGAAPTSTSPPFSTSLTSDPIPTTNLLAHLPTHEKESFLSTFYADWVNANEAKQKAWVKQWWNEVWWTGVVGGWKSWRAGVASGRRGRGGFEGLR